MSKGTSIIVTADPMGVRQEGIISGTPYPGYCMQIKAATAPVSGRHTWEARSLTAGTKGEIALLLEDDYQRFLGVGAATAFGPGARGTAYVSGTRGFIYDPVQGEDFNIYILDIAGTADDVAIGDLFGVAADGTWHSNSSYGSAPMKAMEVITDPSSSYMLWSHYLGNQA